jgi:uncharacterized protein (TIGR04141 family)
MDESKLPISLYRIKSDEVALHGAGIWTFLDNLLINDKSYKKQQQNRVYSDSFDTAVYYQLTDLNPKWKDFLGDFLTDGQELSKKGQGKVESFVLFIQQKETNTIYVLAGGYGYFAVQDIIDNDFGIDILSRLIQREDRSIKAVREVSVIGNILGTTKFFRKDFNLYENDGFGKIYQELRAQIDEEIVFKYFGLSKDEFKTGPVCIAKASFKINKSLTSEEFTQLVVGCNEIVRDLEAIAINAVEKLGRSEKTLKEILNKELGNQLWSRFSDPTYDIDFDLCHPEYEKYLTSSEYEVRKGYSKYSFFGHRFETSLVDADMIFNEMKKSPPATEEEFLNLIASFRIYSFDEAGLEQTKGSFLEHLFGDVSHNGTRYFYVNKTWYRIDNAFICDLNDACVDFAKNHSIIDILDEPWNPREISENAYNSLYIGKESTIVLDKITPEGIEPCDILKWDEEKVYLIHVKAGFGNSIRELCSQIIIAATRITADRKGNNDYLKKVYGHIKAKSGSADPYFNSVAQQIQDVSEEQFIKLFTGKKPVFVFAIGDNHSTQSRDFINEIEAYKSSIAKFSFQELVKNMRMQDMEFGFTQILRN